MPAHPRDHLTRNDPIGKPLPSSHFGFYKHYTGWDAKILNLLLRWGDKAGGKYIAPNSGYPVDSLISGIKKVQGFGIPPSDYKRKVLWQIMTVDLDSL